MQEIIIEDIKPFIRHSQLTKFDKNSKWGTLIAYDNRIFLCIKGNGNITINNNSYSMKTGTLIMWKPGMKYTYDIDANESMTLIGFNFDYTEICKHISVPIPSATPENFQSENITEDVLFSDIEAFNNIVLIHDMLFLKPYFEEIKDIFSYKNKYYSFRCSSLLSNLLARIALSTENSGSNSPIFEKSKNIIEYIQSNYKYNIKNADIGKAFGYHPAHIGRIMLKATGMSTHQYLIDYRISKALDYLQSGKVNISQICYLCGFNSPSQFTKCFKKKTGKKPSEYIHH